MPGKIAYGIRQDLFREHLKNAKNITVHIDIDSGRPYLTIKTKLKTRKGARNAKMCAKTYADELKTSITRERVGNSQFRFQIRAQHVEN